MSNRENKETTNKVAQQTKTKYAVVAELAYAHDSGSCPCTWVGVQVPSTALQAKREDESLLFFVYYRKAASRQSAPQPVRGLGTG